MDEIAVNGELSARWLMGLAVRVAQDVGALAAGADRAADRTPARVATFAVDGRIRFASAADRAAFAGELADAVVALAAKYHDGTANGGRDHRLLVALHPAVTPRATPDDPTGEP